MTSQPTTTSNTGMTGEMTGEDGSMTLSVDALDALEWAKEFMDRYERRTNGRLLGEGRQEERTVLAGVLR